MEKSYFVLSFLLRISNLPRFKNKKIYPMLIRALFIRREIEREISLFDLFLFFPHFFPPPSRRRRKRFRHIRAEFIVDTMIGQFRELELNECSQLIHTRKNLTVLTVQRAVTTDGRGRKARLNVARPAALISPDFSWLARSTENGTDLTLSTI